MFAVSNKIGCDIGGQQWPTDVHSMSVWDLIAVRHQGKVTVPSCDWTEWTEIPEPTNPIVESAGTAAHDGQYPIRRTGMTLKIVIHETAESADDMADLLAYIAALISSGYTSGYHPGWSLEDVEPAATAATSRPARTDKEEL